LFQTIICEQCGRIFVSEYPRQKFCLACRTKREEEYYKANAERIRKHSREYRKAHPERAREYKRKYYQTHPERIREYTRKYHQAHPGAEVARRARRHVRLKNSIREEVDPYYIYKRDNWICQICGKKVNPKLKYPDPMSASIDHIVPLSLGGTHERKNLQLAHWICNVRKNNGGHDQLRLIG